MINRILILLAFLILDSSISHVYTQSKADFSLLESESRVWVKGGSTLHDWTSEATKFNIEPKSFSFLSGSMIEALYFSAEVAGMVSGRGSIMDKKTFNAFDGEKNPLIEFTLQKTGKIMEGDEDAIFELGLTGLLKMAGVSKEIDLVVKGERLEEHIRITGSYDMKMSDFDMETPSAMFGQIVCDDAITVLFDLIFKPTP
jgi:polyisoprenoid-binding protein YceI